MTSNIPLIRQKEKLIAAIRELSFIAREPLDRMDVIELTELLDRLAIDPQRRRKNATGAGIAQ